MALKVIKTIWFTYSNKCIGMVKARDEVTKEIKFYVGVGYGLSEKDDIKHIIEHGAKFHKDHICDFLTS